MGTEFAWTLWVLGCIALLTTAGPIHQPYEWRERPARVVRVTHAIVSLIWIAPVLVRAWMMVVAA